jgi:hypothetical protein
MRIEFYGDVAVMFVGVEMGKYLFFDQLVVVPNFRCGKLWKC